MDYRNSHIKVDQLVTYLNEKKLNLSPAFQRGHVWATRTRRALLVNILAGKPIPAVFLYKEPTGAQYSYNILDGKQRLESLILFIGNKNPSLPVREWHAYFAQNTKARRDVDFWVNFHGKRLTMAKLTDDIVRNFREYVIPVIEITLNDQSNLDEVISLFVDINQQGAAVKRFDIVKALRRHDPILKNAFKLIAIDQRRGEDTYYRSKRNGYTRVLGKLGIVTQVTENNAKVDRMWERLLELVLFSATKIHRKPVEILREFIAAPADPKYRVLAAHKRSLKAVFDFLDAAYRGHGLAQSRFATDQTHFYTMVTALLTENTVGTTAHPALKAAILRVDSWIQNPAIGPEPLRQEIVRYNEMSSKQTTDASRRKERIQIFLRLLAAN